MISLSPFWYFFFGKCYPIAGSEDFTMSCLGDHRTCQVNISDIETGNAIDSKSEEAREIVAEGPASAGTPILAGIFLTSMIPAETSGVNTANPRLKYRISRLINQKDRLPLRIGKRS